jgi:hypothetical protein
MSARREGATAFLVTLWAYGERPIFADPSAARLFFRILGSLRRGLGFRLHAYLLLPDRARLIIGASDGDPRWARVTVHRLKSRFAREVNSRRNRLGLVWQDAEHQVALTGHQEIVRRADYLHRYPVLSRLVRHPRDWRWSSFRAWAGAGRVPAPVDLPEIGGPQPGWATERGRLTR